MESECKRMNRKKIGIMVDFDMKPFFIYNSLRFLQIYNLIIYHKENLNGKKLFKNLEWISCPIPFCIQIITFKREIALNSYN